MTIILCILHIIFNQVFFVSFEKCKTTSFVNVGITSNEHLIISQIVLTL